jgi:NTE family protein
MSDTHKNAPQKTILHTFKGLAGPKAEKQISLALQGGGAHGAFTWGVLDALLKDGRLAIEGISGTSAGAMNAVVAAEGFMDGGIEGAREQLRKFWQAVSYNGTISETYRGILDAFLSGTRSLQQNSAVWWFNLWSQFLSPYDSNPLEINRLKDVIEDLIDFKKVRACGQIKLHIAATSVRTGRIKIFKGPELTADHVLASACSPTLFRAVKIDGEAYWDGGYSGNPPLYPLFYGYQADDVVLVQINPIERDELPVTAQAIEERTREVMFNTSLLGELRAIRFVGKLVDQGVLPSSEYKHVRMHRIDGGDDLKNITTSSRVIADWGLFQQLHAIGFAQGQAWLEKNYESIGVTATLNLDDYLDTTLPSDKNAPSSCTIAA